MKRFTTVALLALGLTFSTAAHATPPPSATPPDATVSDPNTDVDPDLTVSDPDDDPDQVEGRPDGVIEPLPSADDDDGHDRAPHRGWWRW